MQAKCPSCAATFDAPSAGPHSCPSCGYMVMVTLPGFTEGTTGPLATPSGQSLTVPAAREDTDWERRKQLGWVTGFWRTWVQAMFSPQKFWPTVRPEAHWAEALGFAWVVAVIYRIFATATEPLSYGFARRVVDNVRGFLERLDPEMRDRLEQSLEESLVEPTPGSLARGFFLYVLLYPLILLAGAAVLHLSCLVFGAAKHKFSATFRAYAYASAPLVFFWIPCINVVAVIYWILQLIFAVQAVQETSTGKATGIVLTPAAFLFCCCAPVMGFTGGLMSSAMKRWGG
jgi:hypothetical protein